MPKRSQQQYESDNGFVEDAPKSKKSKNSTSSSPAKAALNTEELFDDDGNQYWELSRVRRVGISTFKNNTFINIREFYEKDGKSLPGKKVSGSR
jgi:hypothetical protein